MTAMNSLTAMKLDRIPMLSGLVAVTLYELPTMRKYEIHGTSACYQRGGCRCDLCKLAHADRCREWLHASGRLKKRYPAVEARRVREASP